MAKKRGAGEGTCYFDKRRGVWVAQLPPDALTGKRPQRTAATQREALALLAELRAERQGGKDSTAKQPTIAGFLETWLDDVIKPTLRPSTYASYSWVVRAYVVPTLGRLRLEALTPALCQRWANQLAHEVAATTVRNTYLRLRAALDVAVDWHYIERNPALRIKLPPLPPSGAQVYTVEQARLLLRAAEGWRLEPAAWALLLLGLRRGEVLGLAWRDFDRKAGTIKITQQVQFIGGAVVISSTPKTDNARRTLPLPPGLHALLLAHWSNQQEERSICPDWKEHGLIFPSDVGTPITPTNLRRSLHVLCGRAGVPLLRVHDCRHTCATLLGEQGEQESVIAALLGHAPATITGHYAHVSLDMLRAAVTKLETTLKGGEAAKEREG